MIVRAYIIKIFVLFNHLYNNLGFIFPSPFKYPTKEQKKLFCVSSKLIIINLQRLA